MNHLARLVLVLAIIATGFAITQRALASGVCQRQSSCQHLVTCSHPVTTKQVVACQHYVTSGYGTTVAHPNGDIVTSVVPAHPGGDFLHAFDLITYDCGY